MSLKVPQHFHAYLLTSRKNNFASHSKANVKALLCAFISEKLKIILINYFFSYWDQRYNIFHNTWHFFILSIWNREMREEIKVQSSIFLPIPKRFFNDILFTNSQVKPWLFKSGLRFDIWVISYDPSIAYKTIIHVPARQNIRRKMLKNISNQLVTQNEYHLRRFKIRNFKSQKWV